MSPEERSAPANGIFLCGSCADLIDKNSGADFSIQLLNRWKTDHEKWVSENLNKRGLCAVAKAATAELTVSVAKGAADSFRAMTV
jgi:hypothetical protein